MKNTQVKSRKPKLTGSKKRSRPLKNLYHFTNESRNIANEPEFEYAYVFKEKIQEHLLKNKLLEKIEEDFSKIKNLSPEHAVEVGQSFEKIFKVLYPYAVEHIGVEYTNDNTLYIFARLDDLDIHMETDFEEDIFSTLSVFEADEIILNMSDSIDNCMKRLAEVLGKPAFSLNFINSQISTQESNLI